MRCGKRAVPNKGSQNDWLNDFEVGERQYVETTLDQYSMLMGSVHSTLSRGSLSLVDKKFSCKLFTCISARDLGDVRYLVCVERLK